MEGDEEQGAWFVKFFAFQSTPSVWRETGKTSSDLQTYDISIHSLRVEGDSTNVTTEGADDISIHSLRVEGDALTEFLHESVPISIHSLRVEGDT